MASGVHTAFTMATIRALKSGKFNVQVRRTGHPPVSDTFDTMTAARKWARKIEGDIDENRHYGYSRVRTLADAIDAFDKSAAKIKTSDFGSVAIGLFDPGIEVQISPNQNFSTGGAAARVAPACNVGCL